MGMRTDSMGTKTDTMGIRTDPTGSEDRLQILLCWCGADTRLC